MSGEATPNGDVPDRFSVDFTGALLLGIYQVEEKLADGGMGSVYRGRDTNLGRSVVVKVPHVRFISEAGFRARFHREVEELVRLEHPHIVRILAQGEHEEVPFFVLQYLGGGSLEDRMVEVQGGTPVEEALRWLTPIADTLDFVHARGTVHRDVKPGNILFDEQGHVFLSDFGVAKALEGEDDQQLTDVGTGVGSPRYMAPEQITGGDLTPSADQYALASALYEALVGDPPYKEDTTIEMLMKKRSEDPVPLSEAIEGFDEAASDAVQRALSRDTAERFSSCGEFARAFRGALRPAAPAATSDVSHKGPVIIAVVVALLLAAGAFVLLGENGATPERGATNAVGTLRLTLLDAGSEPRQALRYRPEPGPLGTFELHVDQEITVDSEGMDEPTEVLAMDQVWTMDVAVEAVGPEGDIKLRWETQKVAFDFKNRAQQMPPAFVAQYESFAGTVDLAPNGLARGSTMTAADDLSQAVEAELDRAEYTVRSISAVFPKEPVGVGARWEVAETTGMVGVRLTHTTTYELTKIEGDIVQLRVFVAQTAAQQDFSLLGGAIQARLLSLHAKGGGEMSVPLTQLYPDGAVHNVEMLMEMEQTKDAPEGAEPEVVRSEITVKVRHEIKRR